MSEKEWSYLGHHQQLNVSYLQAQYRVHGFPRHSHDYYVVAIVDSGLQAFAHGHNRHVTPVDGLILLNPGEVHTGEPADEHGFRYRALYPTAAHMALLAEDMDIPAAQVPYFQKPRVDDVQMARWLRALFIALENADHSLEAESRFCLTLAQLIQRFGGQPVYTRKNGHEHRAVRKVREYIHAHYADAISLAQLSEHVHFSRYYLLHTFRDAIGMPPYQYLESVRVRQAQQLLMAGEPLVEVAHQVGFSSQSHFTRRFKQIIGVPPGAYARQINPH